MKKNIIGILLLLCFSIALFASRPAWITDVEKACSVNELCAIGEGAGHLMAEANARKQLAKIFETKLKGSTTIHKESHQKDHSDGTISGSSEEDVFGELKEVTEQVLKGVEIKKKYEGTEAVYALAALNKRKASSRLKRELTDIDDECSALFKDGRRSSLNKILKKLESRKAIHERYAFISGREYLSRISKRKVLSKKAEKRKLGTVVHLNVEDSNDDSNLKNYIINLLLSNDYKVIEDEDKKHQYAISATLSSVRKDMNVKGFEKHSFMLNVVSKNRKNEKIGSLKFNVEKTGRSYAGSYELAVKDVKKYLTDNLKELSID